MVYFSNLNYTKSESDARYAKLGAANRFLGVNTFNRPINISAANAIAKSGNSINVVELTDQSEKTMTFDFIQPTAGFRNYCNVFFRIKEADGSYQTGYKIQIRNNDAGLYFSTACNFYEYDNKEIKGVANPTTNTSVANKQYVDGIIKYVEKAGGLSFTKQEISTVSGARVNKYYADVPFSLVNIPNGKHIISCYLKSIPASGHHLVITFFPQQQTNQALIEIYQYNNTTDITTQLNGATYCFTYLNV